MTKKVTYICDRCGDEFEEYGREYKISSEEIITDKAGNIAGIRTNWIDLCHECELDLVEFFKRTRGLDRDVEAVENVGTCTNCTDEEPAEDFDLD